MNLRSRRTHSGFVLVLTLWVMVIVTLAAAYFSEQVTNAVDLAQKSRLNAQASIDIASTRAEVLYRLATTSLTVDGLGRGNTLIALDNRPYRSVGGTVLRLQDTRGLLNLNQTPDDRLLRFLGLIGIAPEQRSRMIDTLRDYVDPDKLRRLNGAEDEDYRARGLAPPTNNNLTTPWEARRILGWRDAPQLWQTSRFIELTTTGTALGLNPNTAPAQVLATLPGVTDSTAQALILRRREMPIQNPGELAALAGIPEELLEMQIMVIPADSVRITQSVEGQSWAVQYTVSVTPNSNTTPWRVDYYSRVDTEAVGTRLNSAGDPSSNPAGSQSASELPPRSTALPDSIPALKSGG